MANFQKKKTTVYRQKGTVERLEEIETDRQTECAGCS